ncbi:Endonuclease/exonuclease/phosphatase family domain-containing protein 1 [Fasciolopsis buskii]|uniref:Endonuclease/exonuclease/phosphatase family domain-containing protein 1 n=1 Tax=Fasciolopsis buskii TaxID=27845 RepID=A0A8E0VJK2_9TREM|nr:Endonuclease/exonuclease/phosphatase family domain-containing protein 1 [Fasciolopsis buski]
MREILTFVAQADDETSDLVNSVLQSILLDLIIRSDDVSLGSSNVTIMSCPMVNQTILKRIALHLKRNHCSSFVRPLIPNPSSMRHLSSSTETPMQTELDRINTDHDWRYNLFMQCSKGQLELLFQMEAVKNWSTLMASSRLDCADDLAIGFPPLYREHCSSSSAGYIRVASWNLNRFTLAKAKHPGFREVLCLTILRARISLLVLQEVASLDVVNVICSELNNPTLPHIKQWLYRNPPTRTRCWEAATSINSVGSMFRSSEFAVFLYDKHSGIRIKRTHLLEPRIADAIDAVPKRLRVFSRSPCCALCSVRDERFILVSVHLKAQGLRRSQVGETSAEVEAMTHLVQAFNETQPESTHLVIIGDFNLNPDHKAFSGLKDRGLKSVLEGNQPTTVAGVGKANMTAGNRPHFQSSPMAYDNAWILSRKPTSLSSSEFFTGHSGVITNCLRHPLIPDDTGAGANGFLSDHCPIWFDLMVP